MHGYEDIPAQSPDVRSTDIIHRPLYVADGAVRIKAKFILVKCILIGMVKGIPGGCNGHVISSFSSNLPLQTHRI